MVVRDCRFFTRRALKYRKSGLRLFFPLFLKKQHILFQKGRWHCYSCVTLFTASFPKLYCFTHRYGSKLCLGKMRKKRHWTFFVPLIITFSQGEAFCQNSQTNCTTDCSCMWECYWALTASFWKNQLFRGYFSLWGSFPGNSPSPFPN